MKTSERWCSLLPMLPVAITIPGADLELRMGMDRVVGNLLLNCCERCREQLAGLAPHCGNLNPSSSVSGPWIRLHMPPWSKVMRLTRSSGCTASLAMEPLAIWLAT